MSNQHNTSLKELMKEFSSDFGMEFIENFVNLRNQFQANLEENLQKATEDHPEFKEVIGPLSKEISKSSFEFTMRVIKPMWEKIDTLEREVKFLRQK